MPDKNYELIEHTADIGIKVRGSDLKELFQNASLAMFDIIAQKIKETTSSKIKEFHIIQEAACLDELFVNWLNELLSLAAAKQVVFYDFKFSTLNKTKLEAVALAFDNKEYKTNAEIKAATYHELMFTKSKSQWLAQVIFDV